MLVSYLLPSVTSYHPDVVPSSVSEDACSELYAVTRSGFLSEADLKVFFVVMFLTIFYLDHPVLML